MLRSFQRFRLFGEGVALPVLHLILCTLWAFIPFQTLFWLRVFDHFVSFVFVVCCFVKFRFFDGYEKVILCILFQIRDSLQLWPTTGARFLCFDKVCSCRSIGFVSHSTSLFYGVYSFTVFWLEAIVYCIHNTVLWC